MTNMLMKEINEVQSLAKAILASGKVDEYNLRGQSYVADLIPKLPKVEKGTSIGANILLIKIPSYGVPTPPDWCIYLLELLSDGNPGYLQLMYKELLEDINTKRFNGTGLAINYVIRTEDFENAFTELPIIKHPTIYEKYSKLWDEQKIDARNILEPDNRVDTAEYWLEVMRK